MPNCTSDRETSQGQWTLSLRGVKGPYRGRLFEIERFPCSIGRRKDCDLALDLDRAVSARHCRLDCVEGEVWIEDLVSRNGTWLDGRKIDASKALKLDATSLKLGKSCFRVVKKPGVTRLMDFLEPPEKVNSGTIMLSKVSDTNRSRKEALFISDVSDSTAYISTFGEKSYLKFFNAVLKIVNRYSKRRQALFLKCTGDGFLGAYEKDEDALHAAVLILDHYQRLVLKYPEYGCMGLRIALHRGDVSVLEDGDRIGRAVHQVCRMEGVQAPARRVEPKQPVNLPETNRILVSPSFLVNLDTARRKFFRDAGCYELKGFPEPVRLFWLKGIKAFLDECK
jgi:class 3 adenylate cyclase